MDEDDIKPIYSLSETHVEAENPPYSVPGSPIPPARLDDIGLALALHALPRSAADNIAGVGSSQRVGTDNAVSKSILI